MNHIFRRWGFSISLACIFLFLNVLPVISQVEDKPSIRITNPLDTQPRQFRILSVTITGTEAHNFGFIQATSNLDTGDFVTIPGQEISDAVRRIYRTGLFSDVQIFQSSVTRDGVHLEIRVSEQPRLDDFNIKGVKRSQRRDLRDQVNLIVGFAVTESSKAQAVNSIKRYYAEKGYLSTSVETKIASRDTIRNRVTLDFIVERGERIQVRQIDFDGNEAYSDRKLSRTMKEIKRSTWWRTLTRQTYKRDKYEESIENLVNFYKKNGYRDFRVVSDTMYIYDHSRRRQGIHLGLTIHEGPQFHIRNVTWEGNQIFDDAVLTNALGMQMGDVFNEEKYNENLYSNKYSSDVTSYYHDNGYLFLRIEPEIKEVSGDSLDLNFLIMEDEIAKVRVVEFTGNVKTNDDVVRRNLRSIPGQNYNRSAIIRSIRELATLGYFVPENIRPDLDPDYINKTVDIYYSLDESASTDNFEFSGGFGGRQFGVILSARVNFNNFSAQNLFKKEAWSPLPSGDGQRLSLGAQVTGRGYRNYNFSFLEPWLRGRPNSLGMGISYSLYKFSATNRFEQFSTYVSYGKRLAWPDDFFSQNTILQYQMFDVFGSEGLIEPGRAFSISVKHIIERNSLDNFISPNSGSKFNISGELAPPMPGFNQFYKIQTSFQHHIPIVDKLVLTHGLEFGHLGWVSRDARSQFNRFYLGGTPLQQQQTFYRDNIDLKGYPGGYGGSISPFVNGEHIGGTIYNKIFTELRYPVVSTDQVQLIPYVFAEGGNAFLGIRDYDPSNLKRSAGFGTRVFLPILGLIDLSYGYRFDGIPGTFVQPGRWEFLFNIGAPF